MLSAIIWIVLRQNPNSSKFALPLLICFTSVHDAYIKSKNDFTCLFRPAIFVRNGDKGCWNMFFLHSVVVASFIMKIYALMSCFIRKSYFHTKQLPYL